MDGDAQANEPVSAFVLAETPRDGEVAALLAMDCCCLATPRPLSSLPRLLCRTFGLGVSSTCPIRGVRHRKILALLAVGQRSSRRNWPVMVDFSSS